MGLLAWGVAVAAVLVAIVGLPDDATVLQTVRSIRASTGDVPGVQHLRDFVWGSAVGAPRPPSQVVDTQPVSKAPPRTPPSTSGVDPRPHVGMNPVADPDATIVSPDGVVRLTLLTSRLLRLEYARDGVFENAATFAVINRRLPVPAFTQTTEEHPQALRQLVLKTEHMIVTYTYDPSLGPASSLDSEDDTGVAPFTAHSVVAQITMPDGSVVQWYPGKPNEGQLHGTLRTLDSTRNAQALDCKKYGKVSQLCTEGIISRSGWAVVDDTVRPRFDDDKEWPWVQDPPSRPYVHKPTGTHARIDWYLYAHGTDYRGALADFIKVSGRITMPPKYSFGVFFSRWWPFSDVESMDIISEYQSYAIPLDVMVTDMDWHKTCYRRMEKGEVDQAGQQVCWTGHTWDNKYFPDPGAYFRWAAERGVKTSLNLHLSAGVQPDEDGYPGMAADMGIDPASRKYAPFNIVNKTYALAYHKNLLKPVEDLGLGTWWLDWQQGEDWFSSREGYSLPDAVHPTWYLNYVFSTQPGRWGNGERPLILHRWGGLGCHRFPVGFSGDVYPNWDSFRYQPYFTSQAANVGFGYWSHDIGGFMLPPGGELYTRWIQFGVLSPVFRTHGSRLAENIKRVWFSGMDWFPAMREALQLRAKLVPYIYTHARRAYDTGVSLVYPLYYDHPTFDEAYDADTQYMFGDDMMVAPVVKKITKSISMTRNMPVWVPPGEWVDWYTGHVAVGPTHVNRSFTIYETGLYVKSGAVVVTKLVGAEDIQDTAAVRGAEWLGRAQDVPQTLEAQVFLPLNPGDAFSGEAYHYEDDGDNIGYKGDASGFQWTRFSYTLAGDDLAFTVGAAVGSHPRAHPARSYSLRFRACVPPSTVTVGGVDVPYSAAGSVTAMVGRNTWHYDGSQMAVVVQLFERFPVGDAVEVVLRLPAGQQAALRPLMDGVQGCIARARLAKPMLDNHYPRLYPEDYDHVAHLSETGARASYDPSSVPGLLRGLDATIALAVAEVKAMKGIPSSARKTAHAMLTHV